MGRTIAPNFLLFPVTCAAAAAPVNHRRNSLICRRWRMLDTDIRGTDSFDGRPGVDIGREARIPLKGGGFHLEFSQGMTWKRSMMRNSR